MATHEFDPNETEVYEFDKLGSPRECLDVGFGSALLGETVQELMDSINAEYGALTDWQRDCLTRGHALGCEELKDYHADMRNRSDRPAVDRECPF